MQLEDYFDFSYPDYIGIKGHRLGIHNVLNYFLSGSSPEEIDENLSPKMRVLRVVW